MNRVLYIFILAHDTAVLFALMPKFIIEKKEKSKFYQGLLHTHINRAYNIQGTKYQYMHSFNHQRSNTTNRTFK